MDVAIIKIRSRECTALHSQTGLSIRSPIDGGIESGTLPRYVQCGSPGAGPRSKLEKLHSPRSKVGTTVANWVPAHPRVERLREVAKR